MRHLGADIRKIELPMEKVAAGLKQTLSAFDWRILDERVHDGELIIRATGNLSGGLVFWVASGRQLAEWRLTSSSSDQTVMETHYGLDPIFRLRFWFALVLLVVLSILFFLSGETILTAINGHAPFFNATAGLCLGGGFLLAGFALAVSAIFCALGFSRVLDHIGLHLERKHGNCEQKVLQSDYLFPDIFLLLLFALIGLVLFLIIEWISGGHDGLFYLPGFWSIFCILGVLLVLILPAIWCRGFKERLSFIILSIAVLAPVLFFYGLPTINLWWSDLVPAISPLTANGFPAESVHRLVRADPENVKSMAFILAFGNLFILSIAVILAAGIPTLAENLIRQRKAFFLKAHRQSIYRQALEARTFSWAFVPAVLVLWLMVTAMLFWVLYTGLSVFEMGLCGRQMWFASLAGRVFFDTLHLIASVIVSPLHANNLAVPAARAMALIYGAPLVGVIVLTAARRWTTWQRKQRLLRGRSSARSERDMRAILSRCGHIARGNGLRGPLFIVDSSPLPTLQCFFMGFPHFKSVLVVSRGCLRLTPNEIEGLLAHELFHIKRHTRRWYLLSLLSDITLFGTGFLNVLSNAFENELAADRFAMEWLHRHNISAADYTQALRIVSMAAAVNPAGGPSLLASTPAWPAHALPRGRWRLLFELYFGDTVVSYIHPPLEERIAIIEAIDAGPPSIDESGPAAG